MRILLVLLIAALPAFAVEPDEMLADPALETRAQEIGAEVRCPQCQNESVEDSNAQIARDLRLVIRERLSAGDSNDEVLTYLTDRFGEFVRLRPRFGGATLWLWLAAPAVFLIGIMVTISVLRRKKSDVVGLSAEEDARLAALLKDD